MASVQEAVQIVQQLQSELAVAEARHEDARSKLDELISDLEKAYHTADLDELAQLLGQKREELDTLLVRAQSVLAVTPSA